MELKLPTACLGFMGRYFHVIVTWTTAYTRHFLSILKDLVPICLDVRIVQPIERSDIRYVLSAGTTDGLFLFCPRRVRCATCNTDLRHTLGIVVFHPKLRDCREALS
jgi:hypothetical protein